MDMTRRAALALALAAGLAAAAMQLVRPVAGRRHGHRRVGADRRRPTRGPTPTSGTPTSSTSRSTRRRLGLNLKTTNSQNDVAKLVANVQTLISQGVKGIVMAPQDTAAIASTLDTAGRRRRSRSSPSTPAPTRARSSWSYAPTTAPTARRRASSSASKLGGKGKVVEFQGDLASINGRDRSEAFADCMKKNFPEHQGVRRGRPSGRRDAAAAKLQTRLAANPDIKGIYMQAGGVFLAPTLQTAASSKGLLVPPSDPKHIFDRLQRRHPAGARGDPQGQDRRHRLPAGRPVRQVRPVLRQGRDRGQDLPARPDRPRQHHRRGPQRPAGGPAPRPAGDQGQRRRPDAVGQHRSDEHASSADRRAGHRRPAVVEARRRHQAVRRHRRAGRRAGITVRPGETHALVGRNGAGKSTLVSILTGLQAPGRGRRSASTASPRPRSPTATPGGSEVACVYQKSTDHPRADRRREPVPQPAARGGGG